MCGMVRTMKVYVNRRPINAPWGGGNMFVKALYEHLPQLGSDIIDHGDSRAIPNVVFVVGLDDDGRFIAAEQAVMYKLFQPNVKVILRVNENDARKGTHGVDQRLMGLSACVDGTVFVSNWLRDHFIDLGWHCQNNAVIINGVDEEVFKPRPKLNNGKLNIVTHHWSNNSFKGFDIYDRLDEFVGRFPDKYAFTYIGRDRGSFKNTTVIRPLMGERLGEELGKHDVYVSASRADPGPNHLLEALACNLPTYVSVEGGGCVEFAGQDHVFRDWDDLKTILEKSSPKPNRAFVPGRWQSCIREYNDFLEATCQAPTTQNPPDSTSC